MQTAMWCCAAPAPQIIHFIESDGKGSVTMAKWDNKPIFDTNNNNKKRRDRGWTHRIDMFMLKCALYSRYTIHKTGTYNDEPHRLGCIIDMFVHIFLDAHTFTVICTLCECYKFEEKTRYIVGARKNTHTHTSMSRYIHWLHVTKGINEMATVVQKIWRGKKQKKQWCNKWNC